MRGDWLLDHAWFVGRSQKQNAAELRELLAILLLSVTSRSQRVTIRRATAPRPGSRTFRMGLGTMVSIPFQDGVLVHSDWPYFMVQESNLS